MEARYLRVKHWRDHQHYNDRRPPWIKLKRDLIDGDDGRRFREELTEIEQWQLVRIWLYASGSERVQTDENGREVPVVAYDERTLRIGIRSEKKVAVDKFVRLGFLEPVSEDELASRPLADGASRPLAHGASTEPPKPAPENSPPRARARGTETAEVPEEPTEPVTDPVGDNQDLKGTHSLDALREASRLFDAIRLEHRDENTQATVFKYANELEPGDFASVLAQFEKAKACDRIHKTDAAYVVGALEKRAQKRAAPRRPKANAA